MRKTHFVALIGLAFALSACQSSNPLPGEWTLRAPEMVDHTNYLLLGYPGEGEVEVVNSGSREPVKGATVEVLHGEEALLEETTGVTGRVRVPDGLLERVQEPLSITATAPGYRSYSIFRGE